VSGGRAACEIGVRTTLQPDVTKAGANEADGWLELARAMTVWLLALRLVASLGSLGARQIEEDQCENESYVKPQPTRGVCAVGTLQTLAPSTLRAVPETVDLKRRGKPVMGIHLGEFSHGPT
jgi:hypothetical protein